MPECKFGAKCYRKNEDHLKEFHPEKLKKDGKKEKESAETLDKRPKKRQIDEEFVEEEYNEKKAAKIRKDAQVEEEEEEVVEMLYDEFETVEEIVEENEETGTDTSASNILTSRPHRHPFAAQPDSVYSFWKQASYINQEEPRDAFSEVNGMRLVGFFDFLAGDLTNATDDEIRIHARFATDLPEMQTILVTNSGRYAFWRDTPIQLGVMVVYVKNGDDHFTKITMIGDKPIHALIHAAGADAEAVLDKYYPSSVFQWATIPNLKNNAKTAIARRNKISLGRPIHSMRLWVPVDSNDVGYRPLGEDLNKLKRTMTQIGDTTDEIVRKKKLSELREIGTNVQLANDECDFGTGLEFGHDLFIANYPNLDPMAKRYLTMAYQLLERMEFAAIVAAHMGDGVRRRDNVMII